MNKETLKEIKNCIALMNNFVCCTKLVMDADQAITLTKLVSECHRLNKILDKELGEENVESSETPVLEGSDSES